MYVNDFKLKLENSNYKILLENIDNNNAQYYKNDYRYLNDFFKAEQIPSDKIINFIIENDMIDILTAIEKEIYKEEINASMKAHGQRHILNVVLFSMILGLNLLEKKDLILLLVAAKYHDVGRTEENKQDHAFFSSLKAKESLKMSLASDDLGIVLTAIEFHEISRNSIDEEYIFNNIAERNGVSIEKFKRARLISELLKDADALDRTRFVNRARLDNRYLKFDISKKLIKFSSNLQETYALEDLEMYDFNQELFRHYTPQEILRKIRKSESYTQNSGRKKQ